jgi:hypothetical protein
MKNNTKTKIATLVKSLDGFKVGQRLTLYKLSPPLKPKCDHVVISAVRTTFDTGGPETFMFQANSEGEITNWSDLPGSQQGWHDDSVILAESGYVIQN